jgi:hypothetical protein
MKVYSFGKCDRYKSLMGVCCPQQKPFLCVFSNLWGLKSKELTVLLIAGIEPLLWQMWCAESMAVYTYTVSVIGVPSQTTEERNEKTECPLCYWIIGHTHTHADPGVHTPSVLPFANRH